MKNLLLLLLFIFSFSGQSQPSLQKGKDKESKIQNMVSFLDHDTCLDKKFSIVFYIVLDSLYDVGAATQGTLDAMVNALNEKYKPICVSFANCSTVLIPNYPFNKWKQAITGPVVTDNWYTEKTINIYIADEVIPSGGEPFGYAFGPSRLPFPPSVPTRSDVIVLGKGFLTFANCFALMHHMGHFFGLPHTYDEISPNTATVTPQSPVDSFEFADGSNCADHGDGFCDTEADPAVDLSIRDGKGQYYIQPKDNYMSLYSTACRYTQQQYNYMAWIIYTRRLYLH